VALSKKFIGERILRMNKSFILLTIMIVLSPALSVMGTQVQEQPQVVPQDFDSSIGVVPGDTIYYNIDQFVLPPEVDPPNVTIPDFTDNSIYVKVLWIDDDYEFTPGVEGNLVKFSIGLMFEQDTTLTLGEGLLAVDYIIPEGSATPGPMMDAVPHWNSTFGFGPALLFINDDYAEHTLLLEAIGFTVTETADTFSATFVNGTGEVAGTWRKSDGICTNLLYDDVYFMGQNFTGFTFEISYTSKEYNPLPVTTSDVIAFDVDIADLEVTGTGNLYDEINQTILTSIYDEADALVGETMMSIVVTDVEGCFYLADTYMRNFETGVLEKSTTPVVFCGFLGAIGGGVEPFDGVMYDYSDGIAPAMTPDWTIYEGYTILGNTIVGVYMDELLEFLDPPAELITYTIEAGIALKQKRDFYYFQEAVNINVEENYTWAYSPMLGPDVYDIGSTIAVEQNGYLCYTETGIGAAIRVRGTVDVELFNALNASAEETGTMHIEFDFKLRNPLYNPPEIINDNILPGFTWFLAIPTLLGVAAVSVIFRRRRR
jgi:hypothetical protein